MDSQVEQALRNNKTVDITTTGRRSGQPRRIEIWFYYQGDGVGYLTGSPGRRDWYANLLSNPDFTLHVKRGASADLPAIAHPVREDKERRRIFEILFGEQDPKLDARVGDAPLLRVEL